MSEGIFIGAALIFAFACFPLFQRSAPFAERLFVAAAKCILIGVAFAIAATRAGSWIAEAIGMVLGFVAALAALIGGVSLLFVGFWRRAFSIPVRDLRELDRPSHYGAGEVLRFALAAFIALVLGLAVAEHPFRIARAIVDVTTATDR